MPGDFACGVLDDGHQPGRMLQGSSGVDSDLGLGAGPTRAPSSTSRWGVVSRDCPAAPARSRAARRDGGAPALDRQRLGSDLVLWQGRAVGSWRPVLMLWGH